MVLPILTFPNAILTTPANPVLEINEELRTLVANMQETMHNAQGLGLAAPQIGKSIALCIIELQAEDQADSIPFTVLINPRLTWQSSKKVSDEEGCLSLPGIYGEVSRPERVRVKAQNLKGEVIQIEAEGLFARALQHEIDHLKGILFTSYLPKRKLRTREAPDYPRI